jgi:hypothetical protein
VWQERRLSKRLLIFCPSYIAFEWDNGIWYENGHELDYTAGFAYSTSRVGHESKVVWDRPFNFFRRAVGEFPELDLSHETDRLPALAGLTIEVSQITNADY